ncbi:exported hypothetical protein [Sphingomonas aurantiaca]|uniref:Uncharacterized protein n=1 Tax=Sphingomonas aurantiaca TaxID=185949 RepID=A0A5E7YKI9_9SPHN|nr:exported hypothetical protein [Sphingomonas aurantiaca]
MNLSPASLWFLALAAVRAAAGAFTFRLGGAPERLANLAGTPREVTIAELPVSLLKSL